MGTAGVGGKGKRGTVAVQRPVSPAARGQWPVRRARQGRGGVFSGLRPPPGRLWQRAEVPAAERAAFLLREHARTGTAEPRDMALVTLRAMALGGMRDHLGGGFHRYSVDADWRVPHFEKMLYDQAQLVLAYVEAAQADRRPLLRRRGARHAATTSGAT